MTRTLESFRRTATTPEKKNGKRSGLTLLNMRVLAFDQALANTGWALLGPGAPPEVLSMGTYRPKEDGTGFDLSMRRAYKIYAEALGLIEAFHPDVVVCEMPPIAKATVMRPESSLMAAQAIHFAARMTDAPILMVNAQQAKRYITGSVRSSKADTKKAVLAVYRGGLKSNRVNEHVSDALALGLTAIGLGQLADVVEVI